MIFKKENDELMLSLAVKNGMDIDKVISAYLIAGDDFFMLLHVFEGQTLKVPSKRRLCAANIHNIHYIEDDKRLYADYVKGDVIDYKGTEYTVIAGEKKVINHYYIPVIESEVLDGTDTEGNDE